VTYFPKNGERRGAEMWDSASKAWVPAGEWQQRQWAREDAAFARMSNQGELKCPMIAVDSMRTLQSQATGKWYDSKSSLRREYKQLGMIEVGSEPLKPRAKPPIDRQKLRDDVRSAAQAVGFNPEQTIDKIVPDPDGMARLRFQGKI
jgi:hypothetical protein